MQESLTLHDAFLTHRLQLRQVAQRIVISKEVAEEIVQEIYLKLIESGKDFNIKQYVPYLFRTVRNLAIDYHRRTIIESHVFAVEEEGVNVPAVGMNPETILIGRDNLRIVTEILAQLPERTRRAFELYRMGDCTQRDIAVKLNVSTTLVNFMIRDACVALTACYDQLIKD